MKLLWDSLLKFIKPAIIFTGKIGLPKRLVGGKDYYAVEKVIKIGDVLLTKTNYEFSNLYNPTKIKHAGTFVGEINNDGIKYVAEAVGKGVVLTDLVTFITSKKDILVVQSPNYIRIPLDEFNLEVQKFTSSVIGVPYDYFFGLGHKKFYCFELSASILLSVHSELQLKCKEIVKGKRIYNEDTFLDSTFFRTIYDSRIK